MDLLERLIDSLQGGNNIPLKHSFLIVSGIEDRDTGNDYLRKFDRIYHNYDIFAKRYGNNATMIKRAQALSEYLTNPVNYKIKKFLFNEIIDARLSSSPFVKHGNCIGLTSLYNALAEEEGIQTGIYKRRDHILTRAFICGREYAIENTSSSGFDIRVESPAGIGYNLDLLAEILISRRFPNPDESLKMLNLAKIISPRTSLIYLNSAATYYNIGKVKQALGDINQAIEIDPLNPEGYKLRSKIRKLLGNKEGSKRDIRSIRKLLCNKI